ncbi:hypothetical protein J14TS2_15880 [Bacillus sp. J14TS2]|uniref:hypothetical protein n=1 Tax=Bacillus sp. J14TS2 TaxID=2807188 RepID=UPI001B27FB07|nr:hypothetical protein [Bacillus sp. J14TS2]GIN71113.1 hypothetical protein J14TS2_15880 [Bacillus sp. J14TS2]
MSLTKPLLLQHGSVEENFAYTYHIFDKAFMQQKSRPRFEGKFIYFEISKIANGITYPYPEKLMHIASLTEKREHTIFPCTNDISNIECLNKCTLAKAHTWFIPLKRNECLYRMARIHWIPEIIKLANRKDLRVKIWIEKKRDKRNKVVEKTFLRYQEGIVDYLIILKNKLDKGSLTYYIFETAFPVFLIRSKSQYDKKYEEYTQTLQTN